MQVAPKYYFKYLMVQVVILISNTNGLNLFCYIVTAYGVIPLPGVSLSTFHIKSEANH